MASPDVPERWVEMGAEAIDGEEATATYGYESASWRVDAGHAADLAREALRPVLADLRRQVEAIREGTDSAHDDLWAFQKVLDLLDTGGSDE